MAARTAARRDAVKTALKHAVRAMILAGPPVIPGVGETTISPTPPRSGTRQDIRQVAACDFRR